MVDKHGMNFNQQLQQLLSSPKIPPLESWHPTACGEMDLLIKANGEWWHEGQPIRRQSMIDLFSKVLCKEGSAFYLKTPVEKIKIQVEDAPLLVTSVRQIQHHGMVYIQFQTANQEQFVLDPQHRVSLRDYQGQTRPYVRVRAELDALIMRQAFYDLVEMGELFEQQGQTILRLHSAGHTQQLMMA